MSKIFYDHLIVIEEVTVALDGYKLTRQERQELLSLIDQTINQEILDVILTCLPKEKQTEFLERFHRMPHDPGLLPFIKEHSPVNVELAILGRANEVKRKLLKTVRAHQSK